MTRGLFGMWNDDPSDDLLMRSGQVVSSDESIEFIHNTFGMDWEAEIDETRFYYVGIADWSYIRNPAFVPNFEEPDAPVGNITGKVYR